MHSYHEARETILAHVKALPVEQVSLLAAAGRAVAEEIIANRPLPTFNNSAMDGFAVRAADCTPGCSLPIAGYLSAGDPAREAIRPGTAIKIMTGAPIPAGADAVIPFEEIEERPDSIRVLHGAHAGDHIRWRGEDVAAGTTVLAAGTFLRPPEISLLAALGTTVVRVHRRAQVAILATGDELREAGETLAPGCIVDSNSLALAAAVQELGATPVLLGIAGDNAGSLREKLAAGLQADALITSAGVSAGDCDLVREILAELGVRQLFWKINIKPGKPTAFGLKGDRPVFSLPGNPVSTLITFEEFVRPALLKMMGHRAVLKPLFKARLTAPLRKKSDRMQLMRVALTLGEDGVFEASSPGDQNTGILSTLNNAQGIALLAEDRDRYEAGDMVAVHLLGASTHLGA